MDAKGRQFVAYVRVSRQTQGRSGLSLEAQKAALRAFLQPGDRPLVPVHVEVEPGRRSTRPVLAQALERRRRTGAILRVARLDSLAKSMPILRTILDGGVEVGFCNLPDVLPVPVGRLLLTQLTALAGREAGLISERTKTARAAAKSRAIKLGAPAPPSAAAAAAARQRRADQLAHALRPVVEELRAAGARSLGQLAIALNKRGIGAPRGGLWTPTAVRRVLARLEE